MQQVLSGSSSDVLNPAATEYISFWPTAVSLWGGTETARRQMVAGNGRIKHLRISMNVAAGAGTYTFNLRKNAAAAGPTVALANPATSGADLTNVATFAAGDILTLECVPTGTPTNTPQIKWCAIYEDTDTFNKCIVISGINNAMGTGIAQESSLGGGELWGNRVVNDINFSSVSAVPGTFKDLYVLLSGAPGVGTSYALTPQINAGGSGVSVTISGAGTSGNDTSLGNAIARGDTLDFKETPSGIPTARQAFWGVGFLTDIPHSFMLYGTSTDTLNTTGTAEYNVIQGSGITWDATEANRSCLMPSCTIHSLIVDLGATLGGGTSYTFTVFKNGVATNLSVTITGATSGEDLTNFVEFSDGDNASIECKATGTPILDDCTWAVVCRKAFYSLPMVGAGI